MYIEIKKLTQLESVFDRQKRQDLKNMFTVPILSN